MSRLVGRLVAAASGTGGIDLEIRGRRIGFGVGMLAVALLGLLACASGGGTVPVGATEEDAASATAPASAGQAPPPPPAPAAPAPPAPAPPAPAAPASASSAPAVGAAPSAAAGGGDSRVAGYLADPQALTRGAQLFRAVCTGYCHSTQAAADRVAPNLFDCDWDHGGSDQEVFHTIAAGVPDTQMQGFGERLPDEDLWKILAYMRQRSTCQ